MPKKVFNKNLEKRCGYCLFGRKSEFSNEVMCLKRGITDVNDCCRRFKYDPLKREPQRVKIDKDFTKEDFEI
jgi:hypothetical protein